MRCTASLSVFKLFVIYLLFIALTFYIIWGTWDFFPSSSGTEFPSVKSSTIALNPYKHFFQVLSPPRKCFHHHHALFRAWHRMTQNEGRASGGLYTLSCLTWWNGELKQPSSLRTRRVLFFICKLKGKFLVKNLFSFFSHLGNLIKLLIF